MAGRFRLGLVTLLNDLSTTNLSPTTSAFLSLRSIQNKARVIHPSTIQRLASFSSSSSSSSSTYAIDHSGFLNLEENDSQLGKDPPTNETLGIRDKIVNKNPRVLERLNYARRQEGWTFQAPDRYYTYKLCLESGPRSVTAYVEHCSGERVVWASSHEHSLMKRLFSLMDVSAVKAVAQVLARRCLKAGIDRVSVMESSQVRESSQRFAAFYDVISAHGIALEEDEVVLPPQRLGMDYSVVDPTRYVDEDSRFVDWPASKERYDPEKDVLWENEGIQRKHQHPQKTYEQLRPLIDPPPPVYPKATGNYEDDVTDFTKSLAKKIATIETPVKLIE